MIDSTSFDSLVAITNRVAFEFNESRDTCILTSFALHDALQRLGYNSRPLRIEAAVFPDDPKLIGTILGRFEQPGAQTRGKTGYVVGPFSGGRRRRMAARPHARSGKQERMATLDARRSARSPAIG
jgi:hypothetical protein